LNEFGVSAEFKDEPIKEIWGGSEVSESLGLKIYKNSFNLTSEDGNWELRLQGEGQLVNKLSFSSLNKAIEKVVDFYK